MVINGRNGILREISSLQTVCEVEKHHCSLANHLHFGVICHSKLLDDDAVPPERMEFYGKVRRMPRSKAVQNTSALVTNHQSWVKQFNN